MVTHHSDAKLLLFEAKLKQNEKHRKKIADTTGLASSSIHHF